MMGFLFHSYLSLLTVISVQKQSCRETSGVAVVMISRMYINIYLN